ncbi:hypothetical protein B296_00014332 [Ensete ventricosum]|uniref:Uncharacterized protein n=1 Tax=Ensete ventricosum TaxID=4639 RepID=A0A427AFG8_ENSVE|nr:hypothetical protein B296_00014332 [Ensete ventricosum]
MLRAHVLCRPPMTSLRRGKSIEEYEEEVQEPKEENMKEDPQPTDHTTHALASHANPQAAKVEESFKQ